MILSNKAHAFSTITTASAAFTKLLRMRIPNVGMSHLNENQWNRFFLLFQKATEQSPKNLKPTIG